MSDVVDVMVFAQRSARRHRKRAAIAQCTDQLAEKKMFDRTPPVECVKLNVPMVIWAKLFLETPNKLRFDADVWVGRYELGKALVECPKGENANRSGVLTVCDLRVEKSERVLNVPLSQGAFA